MQGRPIAPRIDKMPDGLLCLIVADATTGEVLAQVSTISEIGQFANNLRAAGLSSEQISHMEHEASGALRTEAVPAPPGWEEDELSKFFALAQYNVRASFHGRRAEFARLRDIDATFTKIIDDWIDPDPYIPSFFFLRARAAYMTACSLAMGAQLPEAYAVMRGCLESSLYALLVAKSPEAASIWLKRNEDDETKKAAKRVFQNSGNPKSGEPVRPYDILIQEDPHLKAVVEELYERTIDMGSHPNQMAIIGNMSRTEHDEGIRMTLNYLNPDPLAMTLCLKSVAQVGVCALCIFLYVFPTRYAEIKIASELNRLSDGL